MEEEEEPSLPIFKGGREGAVSEMSPLMRRFEKRPLLRPLCTISMSLQFANYRSAAGVVTSHHNTGIEVLAQRSAVKRRAIMTV
jgi:hypothetical protein